jgi:coenzyme F420-0:L-glutamate ligase/coenzyme F420-1:gamma-L-glutamate ligase
MTALTLTPLHDIPFIRQNDDLADIIVNSLDRSNLRLEDNDIFVISQKVVSKAEGRLVDLQTIKPSRRAMELAAQTEKDPRFIELILQESKSIIRTRPGTIIVEHKLGFICANAGIDHSNVTPQPLPLSQREGSGVVRDGKGEEYVLLLPKNPDRSASQIRTRIESRIHKKIGVMIIDSHGRAWRIGTEGVCIGLSGIPGVMDERGWRDLFGYTLRITVVGVADELAAAASLVMGQAAEGRPIVHVRGFPYPLREGSLKELIRPEEQDLFR